MGSLWGRGLVGLVSTLGQEDGYLQEEVLFLPVEKVVRLGGRTLPLGDCEDEEPLRIGLEGLPRLLELFGCLLASSHVVGKVLPGEV